MRICILSHFRIRYTIEEHYEQTRILNEIEKRGHIGEVLRLPFPPARAQRTAVNEAMNPWEAAKSTPEQKLWVPTYFAKVLFDLETDPLNLEGEPDPLPDIVILRNSLSPDFCGKYNELFELYKNANVTVVNDIDQHIKMGNSKAEVYRALQNANVPIPKTLILPYPLSADDKNLIATEVGYPCVVKLPFGYEGRQVELCGSVDEIDSVLAELVISEVAPTTEVIFQEFIEDCFHTYSTHIVGDFINADIRTGNPNCTSAFKASSLDGNMRFQSEVDSDLEKITKDALAAIDLDFARFDFVRKNGQYLVLEANVSGTFTRTENCNRRNIAGALVDHAIAVHNRKNQT